MVREVFLGEDNSLIEKQGLFMRKLENRELASISFSTEKNCHTDGMLIVENAEYTVRKGVVLADSRNILYKMPAGQFTPLKFHNLSPFCKFYGKIPEYYDFWVPEMYIHMSFGDEHLGNITYIYKKEKPIFFSNLYPGEASTSGSEILCSLGISINENYFARLCTGNVIPADLMKYDNALKNAETLSALSINARGNGDINPNRKAEILNKIFISLRKELPLTTQDSFHLIYMFLTESSENISNQAELDDFYRELNKAMDLFISEEITTPFLELVKKDGYIWNFIKDKREEK